GHIPRFDDPSRGSEIEFWTTRRGHTQNFCGGYYLGSHSIAHGNGTVQEIKKEVSEQRGMNIIGIIVFCIGFGIVTSYYAEKVRVLVDFFMALDKIIMKLMLSVMWFSPIGITSLICGSLLELNDIWLAAGAMSKYVFTILIGLLIHSFIIIPVLYVLLTRKNPIKIFKCMRQAAPIVLSGAALPLSINGMEEEGGVDERVTRFVLPLGANINMDGCALYEAVAVIFIAQINQVQLRADQIIHDKIVKYSGWAILVWMSRLNQKENISSAGSEICSQTISFVLHLNAHKRFKGKSPVAHGNGTVQEIKKEVSEQRGMNIIGIIVFCIGFGIVTSYYAEKVRVLVDFFMALDKIIMKLMLSVMWFSPIGITSLICGSLLELNDIWLAAGAMSK
ncbi:excitatory amino acid transporter 1 domain protein, partial [Ostertagia ostertagi]